jgi:hypothetical protein
MIVTLTGVIEKIGETMQITEKFRKRELIIEDTSSAGVYYKADFILDGCEQLDDFKTGDNVVVPCVLRANKVEKNGTINYYTNINATGISRSQASSPKPSGDFKLKDIPISDVFTSTPQRTVADVKRDAVAGGFDDNDGLPF